MRWLLIQALNFAGRDVDAIDDAGFLMSESTVGFLTASRLILPVACYLFPVFLDLHMAELAGLAEAASLLPQVAHGFAAHGCLAVSKWAAVSLCTVRVVKEIAVISWLGHVGWLLLFLTDEMVRSQAVTQWGVFSSGPAGLSLWVAEKMSPF